MPFNRRFRRGRFGFFLPGMLVFTAFKALVSGFIVVFLWNRILPDLFNFRTITYWQAVGLWLLCRILLGTIARSWSGGAGPSAAPWARGGLRNKWMNMTPEEKEEFRQQWKNRCKKKE